MWVVIHINIAVKQAYSTANVVDVVILVASLLVNCRHVCVSNLCLNHVFFRQCFIHVLFRDVAPVEYENYPIVVHC